MQARGRENKMDMNGAAGRTGSNLVAATSSFSWGPDSPSLPRDTGKAWRKEGWQGSSRGSRPTPSQCRDTCWGNHFRPLGRSGRDQGSPSVAGLPEPIKTTLPGCMVLDKFFISSNFISSVVLWGFSKIIPVQCQENKELNTYNSRHHRDLSVSPDRPLLHCGEPILLSPVGLRTFFFHSSKPLLSTCLYTSTGNTEMN